MTKFKPNQKCKFSNICHYCNESILENCCLFNRSKENNHEKCLSKKCINSNDCLDAINNKIEEKSIPTLEFLQRYNYKIFNTFENFRQSFIPRIEITSERARSAQISIVKDLNLGYIAISSQDLISKRENLLVKTTYLQDLHEFLGFDGKILLLTNISDLFCEKILLNIYKYIDCLKILNPDIITTFDSNLYLTQPLFITLDRLNWIMKANETIKDLEITQIAFLPPLDLPILKKVLLKFLEMGYKSIGLPLLEINKSRDYKLRKTLVNFINSFKQYYNFELLLISTNPAPTFRFDLKKAIHADCFSSFSWITHSTKGLNFNEKIQQWKENLSNSIRLANKAKGQKTLHEILRR